MTEDDGRAGLVVNRDQALTFFLDAGTRTLGPAGAPPAAVHHMDRQGPASGRASGM